MTELTNEQRAIIDQHFRKQRLERTKTEALIWSIRLAFAVLVVTIIWASYARFCPHAAEEQFYSAACNRSDLVKPPAVIAECAARSIN